MEYSFGLVVVTWLFDISSLFKHPNPTIDLSNETRLSVQKFSTWLKAESVSQRGVMAYGLM